MHENEAENFLYEMQQKCIQTKIAFSSIGAQLLCESHETSPNHIH